MKAQRSPQAHVVVIDAEMATAELARRILARTFAVTMSVDAEAALAHLSRVTPVDVVVADVTMRPMTGPQLHERAIRAQPGLEGRFVFTSGGVIGEDARLFLDELPRGRVLRKPFTSSALRAAVQQVLLARGLRRSTLHPV